MTGCVTIIVGWYFLRQAEKVSRVCREMLGVLISTSCLVSLNEGALSHRRYLDCSFSCKYYSV